jgi:hypothetical protein
MTRRTEAHEEPEHHAAVLVAAGVADVVLTGVTAVLGGARELLGRRDRTLLVGEGVGELKARGQLALARFSGTSPAYLEVLARHVETGRGPLGD